MPDLQEEPPAIWKELILKDYKVVQFEPFLKFAGLISCGVNLKECNGKISHFLRSSLLSRTYCRLICAMFWLFALRQCILIFIEDEYTQILLGDMTGYWDDNRNHYLVPSLFLSLHAALSCSFLFSQENTLNWIVPILSFKKPKMNENGGPVVMDYSMHKGRIKILIYLVLFITFGLTAFVAFETFRTVFENFDEVTFRMWIPWMVFQIVWFFYLVYTNYLMAAHFNLVCLMLSERFRTIAGQFFFQCKRPIKEVKSKERNLIRLNLEHDVVCNLTETSNQLWGKYIFFTYAAYIPNLCFVLYTISFAELDLNLLVWIWGTFLHMGFVMGNICVGANKVLSQAEAPKYALYSIYPSLSIQTNMEMTFLVHRINSGKIGFSCADLFTVTNSQAAATIASVASYFLVIADYFRSVEISRYQKQNTTTTPVLDIEEMTTPAW